MLPDILQSLYVIYHYSFEVIATITQLFVYIKIRNKYIKYLTKDKYINI